MSSTFTDNENGVERFLTEALDTNSVRNFAPSLAVIF
jgi:hypothetical protein